MKLIINWFIGLFKPKRPRSLLEELDSVVNNIYRQYINNIEISDEELNNYVTDIMLQFKKVADLRGETISGTSLMKISRKFVLMLDTRPREWVDEHLKYELNKYLASGLRPDYK